MDHQNALRERRTRSEYQPLWTVEQVALYLGVPVGTMYRWRSTGTGPQAFRVGRYLRYEPETVRQWLLDEAAA